MSVIPADKMLWLVSLIPYAKAAEKKWPGMRWQCCVAQAALETGWGKRPIGGWNLWGLKDLSWNPGKVAVKTKEWDKDLKAFIETIAYFEDFATPEEAFDCYGRLVNNSKYYAGAREAKDLAGYVTELAKSWATDPLYASKVLKIIAMVGETTCQDK